MVQGSIYEEAQAAQAALLTPTNILGLESQGHLQGATGHLQGLSEAEAPFPSSHVQVSQVLKSAAFCLKVCLCSPRLLLYSFVSVRSSNNH